MTIEPRTPGTDQLRILFLVSAHNGLSQRAFVALTELGYEVTVAVVNSPEAMEAAVDEHDPELIVCPFLKTMIPESIWARRRCLVVHPGPRGDRGPSSLDWAIELGMAEWGVSVIQATGEVDGGPVWATRSFPMRGGGKSSLYRHEVRRAAIGALLEAIAKIRGGGTPLKASHPSQPVPMARARPLMTQDRRAIDWSSDSTVRVLRKVRAAEGSPGVLDVIAGCEFHLFGAHPEQTLRGRPGEIVARRDGAICRATTDGAVWLTHMKQRDDPPHRYFKLPATRALALAGVELEVPHVGVAIDAPARLDSTYREILYAERGRVGYLRFDFYNGAMSTDQCRRLHEAYEYARRRSQTRVIVLMGGRDYFSNGMHLNLIEASDDPAAESWRNLIAIDDLVQAVIETDSHLVVSALAGDAAAGGVPFAVAADFVVASEDVVLNPYYQHMGGLYGSEYWTYLLPRRVGAAMAARLVGPPFDPIGAGEAVRLGLLDMVFGATLAGFNTRTRALAEGLAREPEFTDALERKRRRRAEDEAVKPLHAYRSEELAPSHECFFGPDQIYHEARHRFVHKLPAPRISPFHDVREEQTHVARPTLRSHGAR